MNYDVDKYITKLTVMELKTIIRECLREFEDEKQRNTPAGLEEQYKAVWLRKQVTEPETFITRCVEKPAQPFAVVKIPEKPPNKNKPLAKLISILLLFFCFIGCSEKQYKQLTCPYCSEIYTVPTHITKLIVGNRLIETCWSEIRSAAREGVKNNTLHYKIE